MSSPTAPIARIRPPNSSVSINEDVTDGFVPRFQTLASILALLNGAVLLTLGIFFLFFPQKMLSVLLEYHVPANGFDKENEVRLPVITLEQVLRDDDAHLVGVVNCVARLAGGVLSALALACFLLLYPSLVEGLSKMTVWNIRLCIGVQSITGFCWILVGLLNDQRKNGEDDNGRDHRTTFPLLLVGFGILIVSCLSMMLSFWPAARVTGDAESRNQESVQEALSTSSIVSNEQTLNEMTEPLLTATHSEERHEATGDDDNQVNVDEEQQGLREQDTLSVEPVPDDEEDAASDDEAVPTSRIRGTRRLLKLAAPQVIYLYVGCITLLIRLPFSLSIPHFVSTTIEAVSQGEFEQARKEVFWLFILGTIDACLDFWCIFWFGYADQRIVRGVRIDTFASLLRQDVGFFDAHTSGELASRINADCGAMAGDLTWFFRFSIESVVRISGITVYMLLRSPRLGAVALSIVPIVAGVNKYYGDWLGKNAARVQDALAAANSVAQETLACFRTVVSFASEDFEFDKFVDRINEQYGLNIRQIFITGIYYMFISTFLINTVVQGTLLLVGSYMIQRGTLTSGVLLAFMLYQGQLQNEMMNLFNSFTSLIRSSGAGDKVFEILDRQPPPPATGNTIVQQGSVQPSSDCAVFIQLDNVHFAYASRPQQEVLKGVNLTIEAGSTVALVGNSGCGKTTIVNLLQRYYDTTSGVISFDGTDIKAFDLKSHRQRIGIVTQDPVLFSGTILSNITYGTPDATREEAIEAAKRANAHEFICAMPEGYDTEVGERGLKLSGGQRQRIAISRAIIRQPALLLLDEATSALDAESEEVVQQSIDNLLKETSGITTIVIAHRLRTVRNATKIACVDDGKILELGSHDELMQREHGYYKVMVLKSTGETLATD